MNLKYITIALAVLGTSLTTQAQQERSLPILSQGQTADLIAMGGNHYGESTHAHIYGNPTSALYQTQTWNVATYFRSQNLKDEHGSTQTGLGGSASWLHGNHALMLGTRYYGGLRQANITQTEGMRRMRTLYDQTLDLAYAYRRGHLSMYATGSYIATNQMNGVATFVGGLGLSYRNTFALKGHSMNYVVTAKGSHLGPSFTYIKKGTPVHPPTLFGWGGEVSHIHNLHTVRLGMSAEHYVPTGAASTRFQVGGEYAYRQTAMLRLGYTHDTNGLSALSCGLGASYKMVRADLSLVVPNNNNVSPVIALSLGVAF